MDDVQRISRAIAALMRLASSERLHAARQDATGVALSRTEIRFLTVVDELGPLPVTEVGAVLHLSQPTASRTLRRLEEEGLVRRSNDAADGRVARHVITAAGRRTLGRFEAYRAKQLEAALDGISPAQRRDLADLLEQLVVGMHREDQEPTTARSRTRSANTSPVTGRE